MAERVQTKLSVWKGWRRQLQKRFQVRRPGAITAIDVDGTVLRVVQTGMRGNRPFVNRIAVEPLEFPAEQERSNPAALGAAIGRALERLNLKPAAVVMGAPRALVVLRTLSLPATEDLRELASMVHFQISKDLPFRLEEAAIDFKVRREATTPSRPPSNGKTNGAAVEGKSEPVVLPAKLEVLAAAVKREVVDFYQQTAAAAGLNLVALGWQSEANARFVDACVAANGDESVALVSLRTDEVGVEIISRQSLLFSRGATIKLSSEPAPSTPAALDPAASEKAADVPPLEATPAPGPATFADAVTIEVVRSLHSYGGVEQHIAVAKVVVTGATGQETAVLESLRNRLNIPCDLLDPVRALDLPEDAREHAAGSISALGLALGANDAQGLPFDFLNPKQPAVHRNVRRIRIMIGAAGATAILFAILATRSHLVNQRLKIQRQVQAELAAAEKKRPIYKQMRQQATTAQEWLKENRPWLEHYAYLSAVLPSSEEIYVSSIAVGSQGSIRLGVQAHSGEILARLDKQLRAAGYDVKPLAITPGTDKHGYNFRSTVELSAPDTMKIDLAKANPPARPADDASLDAPFRVKRETVSEAPAKPRAAPPIEAPPKPQPEVSIEAPIRPRGNGATDMPNRPRRRGGSGP